MFLQLVEPSLDGSVWFLCSAALQGLHEIARLTGRSRILGLAPSAFPGTSPPYNRDVSSKKTRIGGAGNKANLHGQIAQHLGVNI
jgi:hypothetical protein